MAGHVCCLNIHPNFVILQLNHQGDFIKLQAKNRVKFLIKLLLTAAALYFVFRKIDVAQFKEAIWQANWAYFLLALLAFNLSKMIAALRLKHFYKAAGLQLSHLYNLKLYYVGMFYNLFLPGSVGGDGYKVYLLKQQTHVPLKLLVSATLLERLSGLVLLATLTGGLLFFSSLHGNHPWLPHMAAAALLLPIPVFYLLQRLVFKRFLSVFAVTSIYSFWVQAGQLLSAMCLLWALNINSHYTDYLSLFMLSSVVAVLPFTIGGVGAREMVFIFAYQYMPIQEAESIAFTMLFFSITAITAFIGLAAAFGIDKKILVPK